MQEQYDPTTVVGAPPQPAKSNKTGWILLIGGLGCLGLLILVAVVGIAVAIWLPSSVRSSRVHYSPPRGRVVHVRGGSMSTVLRSVEYIGSPKGGWTDFEMPLYVNVGSFVMRRASRGDDPSKLRGRVIFAADGTSGTATVDLSSLDKSRKGTMHLSFELDKVSKDWKFTLDKMEGP